MTLAASPHRPFALSFAVVLWGVACGGTPSSPPASDAASDAPAADAPAEASVCPPGTMPRSLQHYAPCTCDGECPEGDVCSAPPTMQSDPPRICRPACTSRSQCTGVARDVGGSADCGSDGYCWAYCARVGAVGACTASGSCQTGGAPDGYCIRR